ncbi:MAG TPA: isoleucine--tRNA ligase, partial [Methylomirabilota bacterium]|nr:isoleucine--tRNA ligase [Methylomirabilota bacterium]
MKADLVAREPERLKKWESSGLYQRLQQARQGARQFVLHDGPPFANGDVHIGTALNKILKDIVVKSRNLRGLRAPYVPGWDCHGLPIEFKVTQDLRKAGGDTSDTAAVRRACDAYARKYIDIQRTQFKRLGVLGDWDNPYLTLNKEYEADELRLFADIVEKGFVYRGKKPVYWCIPCRTALADAEVEYHDHVSPSIYVKFPIVGRPGTSLVIWTTTPWTLPANLAVAYNSTFSYAVVRHGNEDYIVSAMLLSTIAEKCGWQGYEIIRHLDGGHLSQIEYQHPFCNRTGKLFAGDAFVENSTGTGFVHIAPGHGLEDYHLGSQNGLPIYSPIDDDGRFTHTADLPADQQMPAEMLGKSILEKHGQSEANEAVLHQLRLRHALLHQENYHHSYPHCWRSKNPVIFRAMDQWFIEIDHEQFRQHALTAIDQIAWVPEWGINRIKGAVQARPDWCISRQRSWGVPIPAFYDAQGGPILNAQIIRKAADLIEQHGSNVWFEKTAAELWAALKPADWKGPEPATKSTDTLDVWIDSGSSSRAVTGRRPELRGAAFPFQADMYLEGSDQTRGWFQSSLLLSLA